MLAYLLFIVMTITFTVSFFMLGKEWYAPYTLYCVPFLLLTFIGANNQWLWGYELNIDTFLAFWLNLVFFLIGCLISKGIKGRYSNLIRNNKIIYITKKKIITLFCITFAITFYYYHIISSWGESYGMNLLQSINYVMIMSKFQTGEETIHKPLLFKFLILFIEILPYILSYWIARCALLKEEFSIKWLIICYITCLACLFFNGSRGPLVECIVALFIACGIVYYQREGKKFFSYKIFMPMIGGLLLTFIGFFNILPYMGRSATADRLIDSIYQYMGSQIYNFNYWTSYRLNYSSGFFANTLASLYKDLNTFLGLDLSYYNKTVRLFFVTSSNGHDMGNVFTCLFPYYADAGIFGVILFAFISGYISQRVFLNIKNTNSPVDITFPVYLYISVNLLLSFFGSRFYTNIFTLKFILKVFYIIILYKYIIKNNSNSIYK